MIVVDATVLADFLAGDSDLRAAAEALMREDPDWITVGLWRYELGNVLWKTVRFGNDDPEVMRAAIGKSRELLLESVETVDLGSVWEIAHRSGLTYYDASYVWLAESRDLVLRTRGGEILREFPGIALPMPVIE